MTEARPEQKQSEALLSQLEEAKAVLGHSFEGRWAWWRRRRKAAKKLNQLQNIRPSVLDGYASSSDGVQRIVARIKRMQRRKAIGLWLRILFASVVAVVSRYLWIILSVIALAILGVLTWWILPVILELITPLPEATDGVPTDAGGDATSGAETSEPEGTETAPEQATTTGQN